MPPSGVGSGGSDTSLDDVAFLVRADHRVEVLTALADRPRSRTALEELTDVSRTTVGRSLQGLEERGWVVGDGREYRATEPGAFVAAGVESLVDRIDVERALRDVWDLLPTGESGFGLEACRDAVVTVARTDDPYAPLNRWVELLDASDRLRFVGSDVGLVEPCREELRRMILGGMRAEVVDPPEHARHVLSTHPEFCEAVFGSENLALLVHEGLPEYGLGILDDRVTVCGYHPEDGTVRVVVDTDAADVREWAESTYESYRRDARPLPEAPTP